MIFATRHGNFPMDCGKIPLNNSLFPLFAMPSDTALNIPCAGQAPQELPSPCSSAVPATRVPRVGRRECWLPRAHRPRRDRVAPRRRHPLNRSCQLSVRLQCAIAVRCLLHFRSPRPAAARASASRPQIGASPGIPQAANARIVERGRDRACLHGDTARESPGSTARQIACYVAAERSAASTVAPSGSGAYNPCGAPPGGAPTARRASTAAQRPNPGIVF